MLLISDTSPELLQALPLKSLAFPRAPSALFLVLAAIVEFGRPASFARGDALESVRSTGRLRYGSDMEGGGPYAYPDPNSPRSVTGFEVELMAELGQGGGGSSRILARAMGQASSSPRFRTDRRWLSTATNGVSGGRATTWRPGRITSTSCN